MNKQTKQLIILIMLVLGGLLYAYVNYLFMPEWDKLKQLAAQVNDRQKRYEQLLYYKSNPAILQTEIKKLESQTSESSAQLPAALDKPAIIYYLQSLAKANQIQPQSLNFEPLQNKGTYQTLAMSFSCTGKPADILAMLKKLQSEGNPRVTIQSLNLANQLGTMRADIKLIAYAVNPGSSNASTQKPSFMNTPIGLDSTLRMFQP
ncbi:MAG: type 4a pilus biogenesis protein PilO [Desulfitobacterium hafniense]|nr:type 4a pilus biogenesis protein PilO [Desulfitobacterium hafniense]